MDDQTIRRDSGAWLLFVRLCFFAALAATSAGLLYLPASLWVKGYMGMGVLFTVGSAITLTKTLRDDHEAQRLLNRIAEAKTTKLLRDFDPTAG
jgi:hypothetical protein